MEQAVAEIRRAVVKGTGVIYPASPMELRQVPHINDPAYDPLWRLQDLNVPLFPRRRVAQIQMRPGGFAAPGGVFSSVVRPSVPSPCCQFPDIASAAPFSQTVVFAESSLGWGA
jgi:hypothetical protein